ncbi:MAG: hypothetical protein KRP56_05240 [Candidatus Methanogranum gryphiswaldense]|nr:MAG: hypothetical protein KRP56_05240 [Candidatus Methanogranum sp. U3.2.1]
MHKIVVVGIRGNASFDDIVSHFTSIGGDVVLFDPDMICGKSHIISAAMHAERAFSQGHPRSKNILTETILYAAFERQIGKAMKKMGPKPGRNEYVACIFNADVTGIEKIGMMLDDSLCDISKEKMRNIGISVNDDFPLEDQVLESIAMVDLLKQ